MADFERGQLEFGLEFVPTSFAEFNIFSEGSFETTQDAKVIQVWRLAAQQFFNSNYFHSNNVQSMYVNQIHSDTMMLSHTLSLPNTSH